MNRDRMTREVHFRVHKQDQMKNQDDRHLDPLENHFSQAAEELQMTTQTGKGQRVF
jgi:hypothetical protein